MCSTGWSCPRTFPSQSFPCSAVVWCFASASCCQMVSKNFEHTQSTKHPPLSLTTVTTVMTCAYPQLCRQYSYPHTQGHWWHPSQSTASLMHLQASCHPLTKRSQWCQICVHLSLSSDAWHALQATYLDVHCKVVEIFMLLLMAISTTIIDVLQVAALHSMILFTSFQRLKSMRLGIGFNKHISCWSNTLTM